MADTKPDKPFRCPTCERRNNYCSVPGCDNPIIFLVVDVYLEEQSARSHLQLCCEHWNKLKSLRATLLRSNS